jgi:RimJ/RimL family protein N-acetyltransferase
VAATVRLERWSKGDLPLLEQLLGDPAMTEHLGGPESPEKIAERHERYLQAESGLFKVVDEGSGTSVGWVGYWDKQWRDDGVYEIGWAVLPAFQGRGIAGDATAQALDAARSDGRHRFVHAFPAVENAASNAICRKLGFTLLGEEEFEYPKGSFMRCNDWRFDLLAPES